MTDDLIEIIKQHSCCMKPVQTGIIPAIYPDKEIKAVLFDIYGTLFISEAGDISHSQEISQSGLTPDSDSLNQNRSFIKTFKEYGLNPENLDQEVLNEIKLIYIQEIKKEHKKLISEGFEHPEVLITEIWEIIMKKLTGREFPPGEIEKIAVIYESVSNSTCPMPGAEEIIVWLKERGIVTGIISNAQFYTPLLFDAYFGKGISELGFDTEISCYSYRSGRAKPDPFLFKEAASVMDKKYNIKPFEVLYTGNDMLNDITAAAAAGMKTALFAGDKRSLRLRSDNPVCSSTVPDLVITDLLQIRDIIE